MEQIKPVVRDDYEIENGYLSNVGEVWISRTIRIPRHGKKPKTENGVAHQKEKALNCDPEAKNKSLVMENYELERRKTIKINSRSLTFSAINCRHQNYHAWNKIKIFEAKVFLYLKDCPLKP